MIAVRTKKETADVIRVVLDLTGAAGNEDTTGIAWLDTGATLTHVTAPAISAFSSSGYGPAGSLPTDTSPMSAVSCTLTGTSTQVTLFLQSGTAGFNYQAQFTVTDSVGRQKTYEVWVIIDDPTVPTMAYPAYPIDAGQAAAQALLTDFLQGTADIAIGALTLTALAGTPGTAGLTWDNGGVVSVGSTQSPTFETLTVGTLAGTITNSGTISGGALAGTITNAGTISGGTLAGTVTNAGTISGGEISGAIVPPATASAQIPQLIQAEENLGRNVLHNPFFNIQQRGTGAWTNNNAYTADRWMLWLVDDTVSVTVSTLTDADRAAIADERAISALQVVFAGSNTSGAADGIGQRIESVRRLSGKTVSISFWAKASSGTPKIGVRLLQNFGSGGSPSATIVTQVGATAALSTSWTRYTMAVAVPSSSGKTFGSTVSTDYTELDLVFSDQGAAGTGIGVQSGTVQVWGAQLEVGPASTSLEARDPATDAALCYRFFWSGSFAIVGSAPAASDLVGGQFTFPVAMRAVPTMSATTTSSSNAAGGVTTSSTFVNLVVYYYTAAGAGTVDGGGTYTATADL